MLNVVMVPSNYSGSKTPCHVEAVNASTDPIVGIACEALLYGEESKNRTIFLWGCESEQDSRNVSALDARLLWFEDERSMLLGWREWTLQEDPDAFLVFEVKSSGDLLNSASTNAQKLAKSFPEWF